MEKRVTTLPGIGAASGPKLAHAKCFVVRDIYKKCKQLDFNQVKFQKWLENITGLHYSQSAECFKALQKMHRQEVQGKDIVKKQVPAEKGRNDKIQNKAHPKPAPKQQPKPREHILSLEQRPRLRESSPDLFRLPSALKPFRDLMRFPQAIETFPDLLQRPKAIEPFPGLLQRPKALEPFPRLVHWPKAPEPYSRPEQRYKPPVTSLTMMLNSLQSSSSKGVHVEYERIKFVRQ